MKKDRIMEILNDWNFWEKDMDVGIKRDGYLKKLETLEKTGQVVAITGVRRSGKSTLMLQYMKHLADGGVKRKNALYVNLEDPRFSAELSLELLQEIYEAYLEFMEPDAKPYIFLDEVQNVNGWEKFARAMHERKEGKIFVSGSSSKLLSKEFGTVLTGRHADLAVYPLNFREFLAFNGIEIKDKMDLISKRIKIKRLLGDFIKHGAFPQVVLSEEKGEILVRYFDDVIGRDTIERFKVRRADKLRALANYYLTNVSSLIAFNRIKKFIGLPFNTVERFSYFLSYAQLIFFVKKFAYSLKEQEVNPRKVYCIDTGMRNAVCFTLSEDLGKLYENAVFLKLLQDGGDVYYWKNRGECDFLVRRGRSVGEVIQVCFDVEKEETKKREVRGLVEAMKKFKIPRGLVVTEDYESEERVGKKRIEFVPLWKWLLE